MENNIKGIGRGLNYFGMAVLMLLAIGAIMNGQFLLTLGLLFVLYLLSVVN